MDRTEELVSLFVLHGYTGWKEREQHLPPLANQELHHLERSAAGLIKSNSQLLQRMGKLIQRKEFSNDPTTELNDISETFQRKLVSIKRDVETLTDKVKRYRGRGGSVHSEQYWSHILNGLQKQVSADIAIFQNSLRQHEQHVQQRESRVTKFGQGSDQVRRGQASFPIPSQEPLKQSQNVSPHLQQSGTTSGYALFAPPIQGQTSDHIPRPSGRNQGVIRRRNNAAGTTTSSNGPSSFNATESIARTPPPEQTQPEEVNNSKSAADKGRKKYFSVSYPTYGMGNNDQNEQLLQQVNRRRNIHRNEQAKAVEESIGKMGKLFAQMSNLVMAQSETIQRIEDDVETGLEDTTEAHADLLYVHELTKGNRSLILKIFGLLVFFILLFIVWT